MKFMMLVKSSENPGERPKELMDELAKFSNDAAKGGRLVSSGGLAPISMASRVRISDGKLIKTDGPFMETKEVVGGFAILEFPSREAAIESALAFMEVHRKFWPGWEGETEIRQVFSEEDYTCETGKMQLKPGALSR